jgi:uncharacterized protein
VFNQNPENRAPGNISSQNLLVMSLISFLFYLVLALLIYYFFYEEGITAAFEHGYPAGYQISLGGLAGCLAAAVIMFLAGRPPVSGVLNDFYIVKAISEVKFTPFDRIQLSVFAGVGEELLFRGAIQPLLGIWITSIIFIGIHGYFKFKSAGHLLFGVLMFGLSVLLGYLFEYAGLIAAMSAHAVYDIIMLWWIRGREL